MRGLRLAVALAVLAAPAASAAAASLSLDERQIEEALRVGERSVTSETFGDEWRVASGDESVTVITPFHRLAIAARHAAFRNEALTAEDRDRALREVRDRLLLRVELLGARPDFARHLTPRLLVGDREIRPSLAQNERTPARQEDGRYLARNLYWFPTTGLAGTDRVTLVVRDADGRPVTRFTIDLARMR